MNLVKDIWTNDDKIEFINYLENIKSEDKIVWTKNIINTNMDVLAIKSPVLKSIIKEIFKGNYISFLDLNINNYYENTIINAGIICKIKDFNIMKKYLDNYVKTIDNWASCDTLSFNIKGKEKEFLSLAKKYIKSKKPFIRRVGIIILFEFLNRKEYLNEIFNILNSFYEETDYYVNMVNAWILCECFIKNREETLKFLESHNLNKFTINKMISKCRDSFRVSKEDKEFLLKYKNMN